MSSAIDDIFNRNNLVPALVIGIVIILICALPDLFFWFMVVLALFVIVFGLLIFLRDTKDLIPLVVMIVGIIALAMLLWRHSYW
jgi:hypothetical protein